MTNDVRVKQKWGPPCSRNILLSRVGYFIRCLWMQLQCGFSGFFRLGGMDLTLLQGNVDGVASLPTKVLEPGTCGSLEDQVAVHSVSFQQLKEPVQKQH